MEVTVNASLNKEELWMLLESLPTNPTGNKKALYDKLNGLRLAFERPLQVYGNGAKIKPVAQLNDYHNKETTGA